MKEITIMILVILLTSCKDATVDIVNQSQHEMYFEIEFINFAWVPTYQGTMIDQDGRVYSYNPGKSGAPVLYHADGYYTERELWSKYQRAKTYLGNIIKDSLKNRYELAAQVIINDFSDTTCGGTDMGSLEYSVYIYKPQIGKYQKIVLDHDGDCTFYNKSESAINLAAWLKKSLSSPHQQQGLTIK
ncbi:MAG: hypothetical protein HZB59_03755 [Ignavibacteriales bacterium]|nr:hypothetical protein [Ignavibacteriales bacterium]